MKTILSLIIFIVLLYWVGQIYLSSKKKFRTVEYGKGEHYLLSPNMYFVIFTVCTAPIFLGSLSLLKYGLWFMVLLALLLAGKVRMKFEAMTTTYGIFFLWLCYTMTYTTARYDGFMLLIKYSIPMLFLWLGYSSLKNEKHLIIFTVCTAPIFLGSLALLKYGLWFMVLLALLLAGKVRMKFEAMTTTYGIFFLWLCYTMTYTTARYDGFMLLIKYSIPMLFLWLGYSSLKNEKDLIIFLKVVNVAACVYCFFIGGFAATFIPPLYLFYMEIFATYAPFADFLTVVFIVPILLYWLTKEKKYIYCALWMVLSTVLDSVRTGMGGMMLVFALALLLKNKSKALPGLLLAGGLFLSVILFVPEVNEKFFGEDAGSVSATDIVQGGALSLDNIDTNGREAVWERVKDACFHGNEVLGSGLGASGRFMKDFGNATKSVVMMHNDYLQIICDTGLVGITLLTIFYVMVILKVTSNVSLRRSSPLVKLTGIMALPSMIGIAFCMYFDNVVSNSMQSMVMPYIYIGFFLKALEIENRSGAAG